MTRNVPIPIDENLLRATVKLNTLLFAGVCALMVGLSLLCVTYLSLDRGLPDPRHFLNLLGVFLPAYSVSATGAWIGFFWGALLGGIAGAVIYRIYARSIRAQVAEYFAGTRSSYALEFAVVKIHGHFLGLALGGLAALGLLVTTNWLVIRGTADASVHAALLKNYFPGYSVSALGSILGAVDIFIVTYLGCLLLGAIYNRIVVLRQKDGT
ncbi:MAG: hypothetical protein ABI648_15310 [Betaproteobacteria bacterium]